MEKEHPDIITLTQHFHNMNVQNMKLEDKFITYDSPIIEMISDKAKQHGVPHLRLFITFNSLPCEEIYLNAQNKKSPH